MLFPSTARRAAICAALALATFSAGPALAGDGLDTGDTAWILSATALVLFMTLPGLALFYAGLVQSKNIVSVLMHHFAIACLMSVLPDRLITLLFIELILAHTLSFIVPSITINFFVFISISLIK